ncbi:MAG: T9SS type A sorting domain-containing protein [Flavobacteriales bacterium]|nr:T9SS type A sorting domain-containing protein [Flavobacteriales bacterium]
MKYSRQGRLYFMAMVATAIGIVQAQQPFDLDTTYRTQIERIYVNSVVPLPDGKAVISGRMVFPEYPFDEILLAGLLANGSLDPDFEVSGLGGGKLVAWNNKYYVRGGNSVRRVELDGSNDLSFGISAGTVPYFSPAQGGDYHVYPDGGIILTGFHTLSDTVRGFEGTYNVIWFSNQGYLDTTATHRQCNGSIDFIHELPDGKFLLSGVYTTYEGQPAGRILRVHPDGALDTTFNTSIYWGQAVGCHVLADGRVLAAGRFQLTGDPDTLHLIRLLPDGTLDPTFNNNLRSVYYSAGGLIPWSGLFPISDSSYVVYGGFSSVDEQVRVGIAAIDTAGQLLSSPFEGMGCDTFLYNGTTYGSISRFVPDPVSGGYYICGAYRGYDDGSVNDTTQRMVSRLYGLDVGIGVSPSWQSPSLTLQPNPADREVTIGYENGTSRTVIAVRDITGREVFRKMAGATGKWLWDTSTLPAGTYVVTLLEEGSVRSARRLVVAR